MYNGVKWGLTRDTLGHKGKVRNYKEHRRTQTYNGVKWGTIGYIYAMERFLGYVWEIFECSKMWNKKQNKRIENGQKRTISTEGEGLLLHMASWTFIKNDILRFLGTAKQLETSPEKTLVSILLG
jgi:hypothetical protein